MAVKKIRVVAYLDPTEYKELKIKLLRRGTDFSKWVRHRAHKELERSDTK